MRFRENLTSSSISAYTAAPSGCHEGTRGYIFIADGGLSFSLTENIMRIQDTQIYSCIADAPHASEAKLNEQMLYRGRRVSLEPEKGNSGHLMVNGGNGGSGALRPKANPEKDYLKMQSLVVEMVLKFDGNTSGNTITSEMEETLLTRGVDMLVKYYAEENVDFLALPLNEQYIAVQHCALTPVVVVRDVPAPVPAVVVRDVPAPVLAVAIPARPIAPMKSDTSDDELPIKSGLSDAQWDASIESLTEKALQFSGIARKAYNSMPPKQQDAICAEGFRSFLKYSGLDRDGLSSLSGQAYLELVKKYTGPVEQNTDTSSNAAFKTVEHAASSVSAPVVEKVAMQPKQRKARQPQQRSVKTLPAIFVSGSSKQIKLDPLDYLKLIQKYGDRSLQAELAMALTPKTDR